MVRPGFLRSVVKQCFHAVGIELFRVRTMPRGIDPWIDLGRILDQAEALVLFDVGANRGQTASVLTRSFPRAEVLTFEPVGGTFATLQRNLSRWPRVHPYRLAFGELDGHVFMEILPSSEWNRVAKDRPASDPQQTEEVPMARLDTFCAQQRIERIHLLKTDCEGHDLFVLRGGTDMLREGRVDAIYCEVNFRRDGSHGDFYDIDSFVRERGYAFYALYEYSGWQHDVARHGFANGLWIREEVLRDAARQ